MGFRLHGRHHDVLLLQLLHTGTIGKSPLQHIDPGGNEVRSLQEYDPRELWCRLSTFHLGKSPVHLFPFRDGLLAGRMYGAITALPDACAQGKFKHFPLLLNKAPPWTCGDICLLSICRAASKYYHNSSKFAFMPTRWNKIQLLPVLLHHF